MSNVRLDFDLHKLECPHCEEQTRHPWPGVTILFSMATCEHCGAEFLVVQNKAWAGDRPSGDRAHGNRLKAG